MAYKGKFKPKNPNKYLGNIVDIVYRSSLELRFMVYCDQTPSVVAWASEELIIPYRSPIDGKVHRYFPDFWVRVRNPDGAIQERLVEIKPKKYRRPPDPAKKRTKTGRLSRRYVNEVKNWGVNSAKWEAAQEYCEVRGWEFLVLDEGHLQP